MNGNFFHNSKIKHPGVALLSELFIQTGMSGDLSGKTNLLSEWIIDWERFFEFSKPSSTFNLSKKIDTNFNFRLAAMTGFPHPTGAAAKH